MANSYFNFKQFSLNQSKSAFKVGTDGVLLGASANLSNVTSILDIGCGTGLISLMLAQRCDAIITSIEPDSETFSEACDNVRMSKWSGRIKVIHTDLQNFENENQKFDLIVTNPPFFSDSLRNPDPRKSAARHNDSLSTVDLLDGVIRSLKGDGHFQLILPYVEGNIFIAEASKYSLYCNSILKIKPTQTAEIRRLILKFSRIQKKPVESFLTIERGRRHEYTEEYINLTKDFYLKF
jgi:tRNA1Val (adenine37-N6)-methyltransferase